METRNASNKATGADPTAPFHTKTQAVDGIRPYRRGRLGKNFSLSNMSKTKRRNVLIALATLLLVLIIGLAAGLSKRAQYVPTTRLMLAPRASFEQTLTENSAAALPLPGPGVHTGDLTYYDPGLGACGYTSTPQQNVLAIGRATFDAVPNGGNPNRSPLCGMQIRISRANQSGQTVSVTATVVDRCGCFL
jgi:hypothetical protein